MCVFVVGIVAAAILVCFAFVGICVSVHKVFSHFSHSDRLKSHESADREESEELCDDAAVILSLSGTSSIILDRNGQIVRSSPDTYRLGAVGNDSIVSGEILEAVEKVRETGNPEEFDLTTYTPGEFRDSEFIGSAFSESEKKKYALAEHIHRLRVSVARLSGGIIAILLDDRSGQAKSERMHLEFVEKTAKTMEMQADRVARAVEKIHDVSDMTGSLHAVRDIAECEKRIAGKLLLLSEIQLCEIQRQQNQGYQEKNSHSREPLNEIIAASCKKAEEFQEKNPRRNADGSRAKPVEIVVLFESADGNDENAENDKNSGGNSGENAQNSGRNASRKIYLSAPGRHVSAALDELLENAAAYSKPGAKAVVSVNLSEDKKTAVIKVADTGCGIEKKEQLEIFSSFYRGSNQNNLTQNGAGLGLSIVKHVALENRGSAGVWSAPGHGSTFSLSLPCEADCRND